MTAQEFFAAAVTGDAEESYANMMALLNNGWQIASMRVRPEGVLFALVRRFEVSSVYAPGLHVGYRDSATEMVARLAAKGGVGEFEGLLDCFQSPHLRSHIGTLPTP